MQVVDAIKTRRSIGRSEGTIARSVLEELIEAAAWAPNHNLTEPWTFTVLQGLARERFGEFWAEYRANELGLEGEKRDGFIAGERQKPLRAPTLVIVSTRTDADPVVAAEDFAATAAAVQNLLLAAYDHGLAAMWRTGDPAYHPAVKAHLGLDETDRIVAIVYLGESGTVEPKPAIRQKPQIHWMPEST